MPDQDPLIDTTVKEPPMNAAEHAERANEEVRALVHCLVAGPDQPVDVDDLDVLVDVAGPYATVGSINMLLNRLAEATAFLQRYIAGLDGHVEADDPNLDITVLLAQACAGLETAGAALSDAAHSLDDTHQAIARLRPTVHP